MSTYKAGTVSVSNGNAIVTGSGTAWSVALVAGGMFSSAGVSVPIASVDSDTSLTLDYPWPGTTASGAAYSIAVESGEAASVANLNSTLSRILVTLSLAGITPNDSGTIAERDALTLAVGDKGFLFLHAEIGYDFEFYRWSGSAWEGPYLTRGEAGLGSGGTIEGLVHAAASKATPVDADEMALVDSAASFGLKKLTWSNLKTALKSNLALREVLTANRTYYVRSDGSDSNNGLADTAGGAFLTIQKAIDTAAALDSSIYDVTIQIASGTYQTTLGNVCKNMAGAGAINIVGDIVTPANVVFEVTGSTTGNNANIFKSGNGTTYRVSGVKFTNSGAGSTKIAINGSAGAYIEYGNVEFSTGFTRHIQANDYSYILATANYTISAGVAVHLRAVNGECRVSGVAVTITGTPAFSAAFAEAIIGGVIISTSATFSGSATGVRYNVTTSSVIYTAGAGASYLPGNSTGTTDGSGVYA